ncbi:MAG TPA: hypothetical protein VFX97_20700 [Pyrinomonadaceae bacterium]|nr:hypothetical protein [Pyrinomonadaceae bacterium]
MTKICIEIDPEDSTNPPAPAVRSYTQTIGNGTQTSFNIAHGLNTADVVYSVRNLATGEVDTYDVSGTASVSGLALNFASAPAANGARVTVLAV